MSYAKLDKQQLTAWMAAAQKGDGESYRLLLDTIQPVIRRFVIKKVGALGLDEDVTQECLLAIHRARASFDPDRDFEAWMFAVVRNKIIDVLRKKQRSWDKEIGNDDLLATIPDDATNSEEESLKDSLEEALADLPADMREAIEMTKLLGLSTKEAAKKQGISPAALRTKVSRAYKILRDRLEAEYG
ncbi:MAG: RNA polymerase subunit sigma [Bdellovibrionaceae bacterium]|nr:RNA polymerase subunit sigma [Pseudobdellovibrionaceae bacterium]